MCYAKTKLEYIQEKAMEILVLKPNCSGNANLKSSTTSNQIMSIWSPLGLRIIINFPLLIEKSSI